MTSNREDQRCSPEEVKGRLVHEILDLGIPPRPAILDQIDAEMRKEHTDYQRLAAVIGSDVGLAGGVMKTVNSSFFGFSRKVRSIEEALLVLGVANTAQIVSGLALRKAFGQSPTLERFWDASASTARVSGWLARELAPHFKLSPQEAYTYALFRDCGIPLMMFPFPEYREVLARANEERVRCFTDIEDELLSLNHAHVGAEMATAWMLPGEIVTAIQHHHELEILASPEQVDIPTPSRQLIAIGQLAEYLVQQTTGLSKTMEWEKTGTMCLTYLGLSPDEMAGFLESCGPHLSD